MAEIDWCLPQVLDLLPSGLFRSDAQGNCTYLNKAAAEIVGMSAGQALGRGWMANLHPDDAGHVADEVRAARESGRPFLSEYRFLHPGGRVVWRGQFVPHRDEVGRVIGHVGSVVDITPHRAAEQRLRQSEKRYQALADNSAVGIWHITPDGKTLYVNSAILRMAELDDPAPGEDLANLLVYDFFTQESRERMLTEHTKRQEGVASVYEAELVGRRGTHRHVLICGAPLNDADGNVAGMIATFTDITARKRIEEELRQNEMRLRILSEQAPAVLWTMDQSLRFTSSTGSGLAAMGLQIGQVVGMSIDDFFGRDLDKAGVAAHRKALLGDRLTYEAHWKGRSYHSHVEPLRGADGSIQGVIGVALDITDRKLAEDAIREARDTLEKRVLERTDELTRANERWSSRSRSGGPPRRISVRARRVMPAFSTVSRHSSADRTRAGGLRM